MVISFQGLGDRGKGDSLLIRARQQTSRCLGMKLKSEIRASVALHASVELWGAFRRFQTVTKHSFTPDEPHRANWAGNSAKRAGTETAAPQTRFLRMSKGTAR
jgi:hypothetical protein